MAGSARARLFLEWRAMAHPPPASPPPGAAPEFVFVKIPVGRHGADPLHLREEQMDEALRAQGLGMVVGWGDSLGERRADGSRAVVYLRVDVHVHDLATALPVLRGLLPALGAPHGTEIHYALDGRILHDTVEATGWRLEQALAAAPRGLPPGWR